MRFNRPLQAAKFFSPADTITLRELGRRAWIAGRDGTVVQSGGAGGSSLCPWTGSTIASGGICSALVGVPGIGSLRLYHAQGQREQTILYSDTLSHASWVKSNLSVSGEKIIEDGANTQHFVARDAVIATGTNTISVDLKAGERTWARVAIGSSTVTWAWFNLATGAVGTASGGVTARTESRPDGWWRCIVTGNQDTTAAPYEMYVFLATGNGVSSYQGDGVSGIYMRRAQLEVGTFPGLYLPTTSAAVTRTADNLLWTPPAALSTVQGELYAFFNPYWSANAAAANPTAAEMRLAFHSSASISRLTAGTDDVSLTDAGGAQTASVASLAQVRGTIRMSSAKWGTDLRQYRGATLAATDSTGITAPWTATDTVQIASNATPTEHAFGAVGLIYDPTPSDATRAALARALNGYVVRVAA